MTAAALHSLQCGQQGCLQCLQGHGHGYGHGGEESVDILPYRVVAWQAPLLPLLVHRDVQVRKDTATKPTRGGVFRRQHLLLEQEDGGLEQAVSVGVR